MEVFNERCTICGKELDPNMLLQYQHYKEHNNSIWRKIWAIIYSSPKKFDPTGSERVDLWETENEPVSEKLNY